MTAKKGVFHMHKSKNPKMKLASVISVVCVILAGAVTVGLFSAYDKIITDKYDFTNLDNIPVPSPVTDESPELDVRLDEIAMHCAQYGQPGRQPLILIHGNSSSHLGLEPVARYLANDFTVYAIDSRCHGQSSDPGVITYDLMARDTAQFIEKLNLEKPYVVGHSDGAIVALTLAYTYPDVPGAVVAFGANSRPDMMKPFFTSAVLKSNLKRHDKLNDLMLTLPDMTADKLGKIICPTDIVIAENDIMYLSDAVFMHKSIKSSSLDILKGENHSSYMHNGGITAYKTVINFLNKNL